MLNGKKLKLSWEVLVEVCDLVGNCTHENVRNGHLDGTVPAEAYAQGIIVGTVGMLMATTGCDFPEALHVLKTAANHLSAVANTGPVTADVMPDSWRDDWVNMKPGRLIDLEA